MSEESERFDVLMRGKKSDEQQRLYEVECEVRLLKYGFAHLENLLKTTVAFLQTNQTDFLYQKMMKEVPGLKKFCEPNQG